MPASRFALCLRSKASSAVAVVGCACCASAASILTRRAGDVDQAENIEQLQQLATPLSVQSVNSTGSRRCSRRGSISVLNYRNGVEKVFLCVAPPSRSMASRLAPGETSNGIWFWRRCLIPVGTERRRHTCLASRCGHCGIRSSNIQQRVSAFLAMRATTNPGATLCSVVSAAKSAIAPM